MAKNKVIWGLAKVAWGKITEGVGGALTYDAPTVLSNSRKVSFKAKGELVEVYADGTVIYTGKLNDGYEGSVEVTSGDEDFLEYVLDEDKDVNNVQFEKKDTVQKKFYLQFEFDADSKNSRHQFLECTANRPDLEATSTGDGGKKAAQYTTIAVVSKPRAIDGLVKATTRSDVLDAAYNSWFNEFYEPSQNISV
jgi:phi13 family phage major tail protein